MAATVSGVLSVAAVPASAAIGTISISGLTNPSDVGAVGPFDVSGNADNSDSLNTPSVQVQLTLDSTGLATPLDNSMLTQSTCDVPGSAKQAVDAVDDGAGTVTLTCTTAFDAVSPTSAFAFHVGLNGPSADTGSLAGSVTVIDAGTTASEAGPSSLATMTVHAPPVLAVTPPVAAGDNPAALTGSLDNTNGAPQAAARIYAVLTDAGGMSALAPAQVHLVCTIGGTTAPEVTFGGNFPVDTNMTGDCGHDFALNAGADIPLTFALSFDDGAPSGELGVQFVVDALDATATPLTPTLASTQVSKISVLPRITVNPPAAVATGAAPTPFAGQIANSAPDVALTGVNARVTLSGLPNLSASQFATATCDTGPGAQPLVWAPLGGDLVATCHDAFAVAAGATAPLGFVLGAGSGAAPGTLHVVTALIDPNDGNVVLSSDAHDITVAAGSSAAACPAGPGKTLVWVGGTGASWSTASNWNPAQVPGAADTVVVPPGASAAGVSGSVCNLQLDGGNGSNQRAGLGPGSLDVLGSATIGGYSSIATALTVDGSLTTATSTNLELADGNTSISIPSGRAAVFGTSTVIRRATGASGTPHIIVGGTVQPTGTTSGITALDTVALDLQASGKVDLHGGQLTLSGPATSTWSDGSSVISSSPNGVAVVSDGATVAVAGTTTIANPAKLRMASSTATLTGPVSSSSLGGTGTFSWQGGDLSGQLTLNVPTTLDIGVAGLTRRVLAGATVTTTTSSFDVAAGAALRVDGVLDNMGTATLRPGTALTGAGVVANEAGKTLQIAAPSTNTTGGAVTMTGPSVRNFGVLTLPAGDTLKLLADPQTVGSGVSSLLAAGGKIGGGGVLQVGAGATLTARGTTTFAPGADVTSGQQTFKQPAILLVDDGGGSPASLVGDPSEPSTFTGGAATDGALVWCSGTVSGSLAVSVITSQVGTGQYGPACGNGRVAVLAGDTTNKALLTLSGPTSVNSQRVSLQPHSQVTLAGPTTFGGNPSGFDHGTSAVDDELLAVAKGASVTVASLSLTRQSGQTTSSTKGTIDVPFVNHGTFTANGSPAELLGPSVDTDGVFTVAGTTVTVPNAAFTNEGTVSVQGSATATAVLATPLGFTESARTGLPDPVTGVFANATLTTNDGAGHTAPIAIDAGGMGGDGTIEASQVSMSNAWLHPGTSSAAGTMTVKGSLALSGGSDLQIVIRSPAGGTTTPVHDQLKVTGPAAISGQVTGISAAGYQPAYLTVVKDVFDFPSHTGTFTKTSWSGTPTGLGWKPMTLASTAKQVDLQLVDVAPPSLGIASIPAFTEFASQRVTYAAVDNKTGVKSYDVRWQSADPNHAFSSWHYPTSWQRTTATYETKSGLVAGREYCFSIRSRDVVGNITPWSAPLCTTRMLDDQALTAHGAWTRPTTKPAFYQSTYSQTKQLGASLTRAPGTFTRVGVIAYACPKCGVVGIYSGKTLLKKWSLKASTTRLVNWISPLLASRTARLTITSLTSGKQVVIDAVGLMR